MISQLKWRVLLSGLGIYLLSAIIFFLAVFAVMYFLFSAAVDLNPYIHFAVFIMGQIFNFFVFAYLAFFVAKKTFPDEKVNILAFLVICIALNAIGFFIPNLASASNYKEICTILGIIAGIYFGYVFFKANNKLKERYG